MTAYNVVRFRTKPGKEQAFIDAHRKATLDVRGFRKAALVRTGDRTFCVVGEWNDMDSLAAARPQMIGLLDSMRDMLEDLGGDLGVTDPVSGTSVVEIRP
ncbi:antibiotic biosynthesis monooxygenase [Mesorhizobium sp. M0924]|uniref:antibiotic biosynthesis monooxygenase family protein n=1 Tax=unclassified Mesorhizobium TaxID=325217 RepID=UPI00333A6502